MQKVSSIALGKIHSIGRGQNCNPKLRAKISFSHNRLKGSSHMNLKGSLANWCIYKENALGARLLLAFSQCAMRHAGFPLCTNVRNLSVGDMGTSTMLSSTE